MSTLPLPAEIDRLRAVNARLLFALRVAQTALDAALAKPSDSDRLEWCPRCEAKVHTLPDGETCSNCLLVL